MQAGCLVGPPACIPASYRQVKSDIISQWRKFKKSVIARRLPSTVHSFCHSPKGVSRSHRPCSDSVGIGFSCNSCGGCDGKSDMGLVSFLSFAYCGYSVYVFECQKINSRDDVLSPCILLRIRNTIDDAFVAVWISIPFCIDKQNNGIFTNS